MLLFTIIARLFTIITIIAIIAIISLLSEVDVRIFEQNKLNIWDGQHTGGIMLAKNPSDLIASFGH